MQQNKEKTQAFSQLNAILPSFFVQIPSLSLGVSPSLTSIIWQLSSEFPQVK